MNLIFIYGPAAVGKLTVSKALEALIGVPLVDNHSFLNPVAKVFGWDHPERERLTRKFRLEFFCSAARYDKSLITTLGGGGEAFDDFIQEVRTVVEREGGRVLFVRLSAPKEVLFDRVQHDSRQHHLKVRSVEDLEELFFKTPDAFARALVPSHVEIDTSKHSPEEMARMIVEYYKL